MLGKLLLCAILFVAINQICQARPQESQDEIKQALTLQRIAETRVTSCRSNLRLIVKTLSDLSYDIGRLSIEILAAVIESFKCMILNFELKCESVVLEDTIFGLQDAIMDLADHVGTLGKNVGAGIQACFLQKD